jgi:hypothetical protein
MKHKQKSKEAKRAAEFAAEQEQAKVARKAFLEEEGARLRAKAAASKPAN